MTVMSFLASLPLEFKTVKSQILSGFKILSLNDAFTRVLCTKTPQVSPHTTSALISHNNRQGNRGGNNGALMAA